MTPNRDTLLSTTGPSPSATTALAEPLIGDRSIIRWVEEGKSQLDAPNLLESTTVKLNDTRPLSITGRSFSLHGGAGRTIAPARNAAIGEAIERYCLSIVQENDIELGTAEPEFRILPERFNNLPRELERGTEYYWTDAVDIQTGDTVEVPAQLVYCPFDAYEVYLRNPITTGAAAHTTYRTAVTEGLLEVLEREAYIINYLREIPERQIPEAEIRDTPGDDLIQELETAEFDVTLIYLTLDIPVHVVLCILWDDVLEFGTFGMDAGFDFGATVEDAVIEAYHIYPWQRTIEPNAHEPDEITDLDSRAEYWRDKGPEKSGINHWLATGSSQFRKRDAVDTLDELLTFLESSGISVYVSDITTDDVERQSFKAVRVISPDCHPMHLNERFRYTEGKRLSSAPEAANITATKDNATGLNRIPHPFL